MATNPKNILNGPVHRGPKSQGAGVRSRFSPREYRDLLEVIRLKSLGVKRRNAWLLHLWLRGHEYPIKRVHSAVVAETRRLVKDAIQEIAPTGRFKGNFSKRAARVSSKAGGHEYREFLQQFYALMVRPSEMRNIDVSAERFAALLCENTQTSVSVALPFVQRLLEDIKSGAQRMDPDVEASLMAIIQQSPHGCRALETLRAHPKPHDIVYRMHGMLADDRGQSRLLKSIENAGEQHLLNARRWRRLIRGNYFNVLRANLSSVPPESRDSTAALCDVMATLRRQSFAGPDMDVYVFALILDDEMPVAPPDLKKGPIDADAVLRALKNADGANRARGDRG